MVLGILAVVCKEGRRRVSHRVRKFSSVTFLRMVPNSLGELKDGVPCVRECKGGYGQVMP